MDVAEAAQRGIVVTRAPGSNTQAVAEHTLALILALAKNLPALLGAGRRRARWRGAGDKGRDIAGLRLGLVGCGAIGQATARLAGAFGMRCRGYDPVSPPTGRASPRRRAWPALLPAIGRAVAAPAVSRRRRGT